MEDGEKILDQESEAARKSTLYRQLHEIMLACPSPAHRAQLAIILGEASVGHLALIRAQNGAAETGVRLFAYHAIVKDMELLTRTPAGITQ